MTDMPETEALQVLTFNLHDETFALAAGLVREVLDVTHETSVPGYAHYVDELI